MKNGKIEKIEMRKCFDDEGSVYLTGKKRKQTIGNIISMKGYGENPKAHRIISCVSWHVVKRWTLR